MLYQVCLFFILWYLSFIPIQTTLCEIKRYGFHHIGNGIHAMCKMSSYCQ